MAAKKRVLFLCIGNSCRSPMAEGFARTYGADVLEAGSAGLAATSIVQPLTKKVMQAKNISLEDKVPVDLESVDLRQYDLIVNLSGVDCPFLGGIPLVDWKVRDPIGEKEKVYEQVRDQIESLVMNLILELRRAAG